MERKLNDFEAINGLMMVSIADIVLSSARILIKSCDSSSMINSILISVVALIFVLILCKLSKQFLGQNLLDISEFIGGRITKIIVGLGFVSYFTLIFAIFLRHASNTMQIIYYPLTHVVFIIALLCIAIGIITSLGNHSVFKVTSLLLPILYFAIFLIFMGNSKNFNFYNVFPVLGNGINETFIKGLTNIFTFTGLAYLFFLPPKLKNPQKITKISVLFIILFAVYILFCISDIIFLFNDSVNNSDLPPLYIAVRYIEFGTFFQRLDATFIFFCILGLISALNINLYFILDILKQITNVSDNKPLIFPCILTAYGLALSLHQDSALNILENIVSKVLFIIFALVIPTIIIISGVIKKRLEKPQTPND